MRSADEAWAEPGVTPNCCTEAAPEYKQLGAWQTERAGKQGVVWQSGVVQAGRTGREQDESFCVLGSAEEGLLLQ